VPDLTAVAAATPPSWRDLVDAAAAAVVPTGDRIGVIGHSGAGVFLPAIGEAVGNPVLVFVDALIPPPSGAHTTPSEVAELLDAQTFDGVLAKWWDWWPEDLLEEMVPDAATRSALNAEMPNVPRDFYDHVVPVPDRWSERPCAYVRLSAAYQSAFEEANRRGWPSTALDGNHLTLVTEPSMVLDAIEAVVDLVSPAG
jgi:hypothetical protein